MNSLIPISNLQHQQTLRPHIEQQIYNAQVRQKAVLLLKDLVIGFGRELRVFQSEVFLRMDAFAEIRFIRSEFSPVFGGACHIGQEAPKDFLQKLEKWGKDSKPYL